MLDYAGWVPIDTVESLTCSGTTLGLGVVSNQESPSTSVLDELHPDALGE